MAACERGHGHGHRPEDFNEGLAAFIEKRAAAVEGPLTVLSDRRQTPWSCRNSASPARPAQLGHVGDGGTQRRSAASSPARGASAASRSTRKSRITKWWSASMRSDPAHEGAAHALEPGLLVELPHDRLGQRLARLDPAARHGHHPAPGPLAPPDQQQTVVLDDDGPDAHLGHAPLVTGRQRPVHDDGPGRQAEALEEVLRGPVAGQGQGVDPAAAPLGHHASTASIIASPTPTSRAPAST